MHPDYTLFLVPPSTGGQVHHFAGKSAAVEADLASTALGQCAEMLSQRFDSARGGFGGAPKFPRPCEINALLAQHLLALSSGDAGDAGGPLADHTKMKQTSLLLDVCTCKSSTSSMSPLWTSFEVL